MNFNTEKNILLSKLDAEIKQYPNNEILRSLYWNLDSYQSVFDLNGELSRMVVDCLDGGFVIGESILQFENAFSDLSNAIRSSELRRFAKILLIEDTPVTFCGKAWSENTADWIYFDKVFDLNKMRKQFAFGDNIVEHQNLDTRSGLESGFIDKITQEGIMGKVQ